MTLTESRAVEYMQERIIGQEGFIAAVEKRLVVIGAGIAPPRRPLGVWLLLGPTGVGKTYAVETLSAALHGEVRLLTVNCGEYARPHEVARLIGAPPGYLGHRETPPVFTATALAKVSSPRSQISVVLFDEVEKGAPELTQILLGVLDRAVLDLGDKTQVDFSGTLVFMTSNLGAREILGELGETGKGGIGFAALEVERNRVRDVERAERAGIAAARKHFSPEFMGRVDEVVMFRPLGKGEVKKVLDLEMAGVNRLLVERLGVEKAPEIRVTAPAAERLLAEGVDQKTGARKLKRVVQERVLVALARGMEEFKGKKVEARVERGEVVLRIMGEREQKQVKKVRMGG